MKQRNLSFVLDLDNFYFYQSVTHLNHVRDRSKTS